METDVKLLKELRNFQTHYPMVSSADLQTFILGWKSAQKCFYSHEDICKAYHLGRSEAQISEERGGYYSTLVEVFPE